MDYISLGCIADVYSGYAFKSRYLSAEPKGIPVIKIGNLVGSEVDYSNTQFIQEQFLPQNIEKYYLSDLDILIAMTGQGSVGRVSQLRKKNASDKLLLNQRVGRIVVNTEVADRDFVFYVLSSDYYQEYLFNAGNGSGQPNLSPDLIKSVQIPRVDLCKQRKISSILSKLNDKIEINKRINQNLLQQAQAMFQLFMSNSSGEFLSLSEVADVNKNTYSPKDNWNFFNYLDTSSITAGTISDVQYIDPNEMKVPSRARRILKKGDIVFSTVRPNQLHFGIISDPLPNMLGSTGFAVISSKRKELPNELIYLALTTPTFIEQMQQLAEQSVSTFPSIRPTDLDACMIPMPTEEDGDIVSALTICMNKILLNNEENKRLNDTRDALLPRLMSGDIDVSAIEL